MPEIDDALMTKIRKGLSMSDTEYDEFESLLTALFEDDNVLFEERLRSLRFPDKIRGALYVYFTVRPLSEEDIEWDIGH